jgi:hypothetical protein
MKYRITKRRAGVNYAPHYQIEIEKSWWIFKYWSDVDAFCNKYDHQSPLEFKTLAAAVDALPKIKEMYSVEIVEIGYY